MGGDITLSKARDYAFFESDEIWSDTNLADKRKVVFKNQDDAHPVRRIIAKYGKQELVVVVREGKCKRKSAYYHPEADKYIMKRLFKSPTKFKDYGLIPEEEKLELLEQVLQLKEKVADLGEEISEIQDQIKKKVMFKD